MGNIGDTMSQTIPAVGSSGTQYATDIDAFLAEVKTRLTALVPRASLAAGALNLANNSLQNAQYVGLSTQFSLPTTPTGSLQTFGGDLYWVTATGQAKITSGNAINVSSVNGITGDYGGANPAQFRFVDVDQEYYAYDDFAGGAWARVWAKNFDLAAGATSANRVRMAYGGAGSYTLTLPPAVPGATSALQMSAAGAVTASNTFTTRPAYTTVTQLALPGGSWTNPGGGHTGLGFAWTIAASANALYMPIPMVPSYTISGYTAHIRKTTNGADTVSFRLVSYSDISGAQTLYGVGVTSSANAPGFLSLQEVLTQTISSASEQLYLIFTPGGATAANHSLYGVSLNFVLN